VALSKVQAYNILIPVVRCLQGAAIHLPTLAIRLVLSEAILTDRSISPTHDTCHTETGCAIQPVFVPLTDDNIEPNHAPPPPQPLGSADCREQGKNSFQHNSDPEARCPAIARRNSTRCSATSYCQFRHCRNHVDAVVACISSAHAECAAWEKPQFLHTSVSPSMHVLHVIPLLTPSFPNQAKSPNLWTLDFEFISSLGFCAVAWSFCLRRFVRKGSHQLCERRDAQSSDIS